MLTVTCNDGAVFTGTDEKDIVRQMKHTDWHAPERKGEYMEDVATRIETMTGLKVRWTTAKTFLKDMENIGLVTITDADHPPSADEGSAGAHTEPS